MSSTYLSQNNWTSPDLTKQQLATYLLKDNIKVNEAIVNFFGATGIAGFRFHLPQREQIKLESEATDHYIENNTPVQDHIARRPVTLTLNGLHGEYFYSVNQVQDMVSKVVPTLALVKQFLPKLSDATKQIKAKYNESLKSADFYNASLDKETSKFQKFGTGLTTLNSVDLFKIFQDVYKLKSAQTRAYFFFEALWQSEALLSVETTWKRFDNMIVTNIQALRDENADITDFSVSFKQLDVTQSLYRDYKNAAGRTREELAKTVRKGVDKGQEVKTI